MLPVNHLESAGAYTWLVQFGQGPVRYLHPAEAARLFGFGPKFAFPHDLTEAIAGIGNAVAPAQIANLLIPLFKTLGIPLRFQELNEDVALSTQWHVPETVPGVLDEGLFK